MLAGDIPSPDRAYDGCRFADRCPIGDIECIQIAPSLVGESHRVACIKVEPSGGSDSPFRHAATEEYGQRE
jgi:hypothetical protein